MTESTLRTHSNFIGYSREGSIGVVMPFCESTVVLFLQIDFSFNLNQYMS